MTAVGLCRNPLVGMREADMRHAAPGMALSWLAPTSKSYVVCRVNGEWISRLTTKQRQHHKRIKDKAKAEAYFRRASARALNWQKTFTKDGDVVEFHELPQDRDTLRTVLSIVVVAAVSYFTQGWGTGFGANVARGITTAIGLAAVNALLPPKALARQVFASATGDTFSTSLQGNQARIDQPIWKTCGFDEINPPYACQPYSVYRSRLSDDSDADPDLDRDQFFYAVFAVGIGNYDVVAKIANTPIGRFEDVVLAQYLAPGVQPTTVELNIVTATEVAGNVLETGRYVGGFVASRPTTTAAKISIDVIATKGLGKTGSLTVQWQVEYREINDFGQLLSDWSVLGNESRTAFTATPQRWSDEYTLPSPMRVEIRIVRTDIEDTDPAALHEIAWAGMRAHLSESAPMNPQTAHYEIVMRATGQLSGQSSNDFRLQVQAYCRTRDSGEWGAEEFTRNPALWMLELATNEYWGLGLPDDRIDLTSFDALVATCDARQDRFDFTFDTTMDAWDALQAIARTCRARVFRRHGILSVVRDGAVDLPVTAFAPRNSRDMRIRPIMRRHDSPDAVIVQYRDHRTRDWTDITCPLPGVAETDIANPVYLPLPGVIGYTHALREGLFEAASLLYRDRPVEWVTEMEGMLPAYLSPVAWQPGIVTSTASGDVMDYVAPAMNLSMSIDHTVTQYIRLIRQDGTVTDAIEVTAGATEFDVVLTEVLDFTPETVGGSSERTKFLIGPLAQDHIVKVTSISDGGQEDGAQMYAMTGLIDDDRVHEVDLAYLPESDEIQDPIGLPDDLVESDEFLVVNLTNHTVISIYAAGGGGPAEQHSEFSLTNTGLLNYSSNNGMGGADSTGTYSTQWMLFGAIDVSDAAAYEVRFTLMSDTTASSDLSVSESFGSWLSLATTRTFRLTSFSSLPIAAGSTDSLVIRVEIRDITTLIVRDTCDIELYLRSDESPG